MGVERSGVDGLRLALPPGLAAAGPGPGPQAPEPEEEADPFALLGDAAEQAARRGGARAEPGGGRPRGANPAAGARARVDAALHAPAGRAPPPAGLAAALAGELATLGVGRPEGKIHRIDPKFAS